jgi:hypothetical protein
MEDSIKATALNQLEQDSPNNTILNQLEQDSPNNTIVDLLKALRDSNSVLLTKAMDYLAMHGSMYVTDKEVARKLIIQVFSNSNYRPE